MIRCVYNTLVCRPDGCQNNKRARGADSRRRALSYNIYIYIYIYICIYSLTMEQAHKMH